MSLYICIPCKEAGEVFSVPADFVGAALMQQHLTSAHGVLAAEFGGSS